MAGREFAQTGTAGTAGTAETAETGGSIVQPCVKVYSTMVRVLMSFGLCCILCISCARGTAQSQREFVEVQKWVLGSGIVALGSDSLLHDVIERQRVLLRASRQSRYIDIATSEVAGKGWATAIRVDQVTIEDGGDFGLLLEWSMETPTAIRGDFPQTTLDIAVFVVNQSRDSSSISINDLGQALERTMAVIDAHFDLSAQAEIAAKQLLGEENSDLIVLALEWSLRKGARSLAPEVVKLLGHSNPDVAIAAVETLGSIGNSGHVSSIIHHLRLGDLGHAIRGYEALARLGGIEAQSFLEFAARNEDSAEGRNAAIRAFKISKSRPIANSGQLGEPLRGHRP